MAANRDLPKLRSSCTTLVICQGCICEAQCGTIRMPFITNEIRPRSSICRDGRAEQDLVQAVSRPRGYREGSHYDESRPSFK